MKVLHPNNNLSIVVHNHLCGLYAENTVVEDNSKSMSLQLYHNLCFRKCLNRLDLFCFDGESGAC